MNSVKTARFVPAVWTLAASRAQSHQRIEVIAKRFTYDPDVITLKRGQPVVLVMYSIDVAHGLMVDEWNIRADEIRKDKDTEIQFTPKEVGHYEGQCAHFCGIVHGSMKLQIDVVP